MREIEHLSRLYIAYQFLLAEDTKERSAGELKEMQDKILKLQEVLSENEKKIKALTCEIEELEKRRDKVRANKLDKHSGKTLPFLGFTGQGFPHCFVNIKTVL